MRKKITLIIIGFILILFGLATKSNALNSFQAVAYDTRFYCLNGELTNIDSDRAYTTLGQFTIKGNTVTNDWTGASYTHKLNGQLGYILYRNRGVASPFWGHDWAGNSKHYTGVLAIPEQESLWKIGYNWNQSVGLNVGVWSGIFSPNVALGSFPGKDQAVATSKTIDSLSISYANGINSRGVTNNTNASAITVDASSNGEVLVGPFNFSYTGSFSSFTLTGNTGANIPINSYKTYSGSSLTTISAPKSGQNFYVSISVPSGVSYIQKVAFYSSESVKCVTFVIMYPSNSTEQNVLRKDKVWDENQNYGDQWNYTIYLLGNMEITKIDEVTRKPLANVGFTLQAVSGTKSGQYVSVNSSGNAVYTSSPVTLVTDANGKITIKNMFMGNYQLIETVNPNYGYFVDGELPKTIGTYPVNPGATATVTGTNRWRLGSIELTKVDETTKKPLSGVGFTIQMTSGVKKGQYLTGKDAEAAYSSSPVTIYTDSNGKISIKDIWEGTYQVVEVSNPHYGYYVDGELPKTLGNFDITAYKSITVTHTNLRRWIKLSGIVWEDMISGKTSKRDSLYTPAESDEDNPDRLVANVTVKLKDRNGNSVSFKTASGQTVTEILTDKNGYYQMCDIEIEKLSGYYIEFTYNGMSYTSVPIIDLSPTNEYSSKASENSGERTEFNRKYSTITHSGTTNAVGQANDNNGNKTYNLNYDTDEYYEDENGNRVDQIKSTLNYGSNSVYGYDGQNFPVNKTDEQYIIHATTKDAYQDNGKSGYLTDFASVDEIRNSAKEEIEYINLGLREREQPDLAVVEDIESAQVNLNGYQHTYYYNQRFANQQVSEGFDVGVKFANEYGSATYTRTIYSSDVVYNMQDGNAGKLEVYVTYKIALRNEATSLYSRVNQVVNYYDNRYDIDSVRNEDGSGLSYSIDQSYNSNGFRKVTIQTNKNIRYQSQEYIYITYKLQNDAVNAVLNQDVTLDSVTEITSYSTYSDSSYATHYAGVDKDSRPGSAIPENANNASDDANKDTYEDDTDSAPSFILEISESEGRLIRGTVWEDNALENLLANEGYDKERKGDGIYVNGENVVSQVQVELLTCDNSGNPTGVASLYKKDDVTGNDVEAPESAVTNTDTSGNYEFSGIIPGKYVIRYTYGNSSIIVRADGSTQNVETEKYKSTIYRGGNKDAANAMTDYWYRGETSGEANVSRLSDARDQTGIKSDGTTYDIVDDRTEEKTYTYGTIQNEENPDSVESIEASTRMFDIKLDYDVNLDNISQYGEQLKFIFDNIDFGIIRRPIQNLDVRKEIAYVQVRLANGQVVIEGDPRQGEIQYLRFLPDGNIHIELDTEIIQGATITIRYEVIVDNRNAEIDYNDEDYYIYGIVPTNHNNWKLATVTRLYDYLSDGLIFDETNANNSNWSQIVDIAGQDLVGQGLLSQEAFDVVKTYNQVLQTSAFGSMEPGQELRVPLEVSRVLSNNQDDFFFENDIEVNEITGRKMEYDNDYTIPGDYVPTGTVRVTGGDDDYVYITITGPTGENREYLPYIIAGVVGFIILAGGVIIIKKKVLK